MVNLDTSHAEEEHQKLLQSNLSSMYTDTYNKISGECPYFIYIYNILKCNTLGYDLSEKYRIKFRKINN